MIDLKRSIINYIVLLLLMSGILNKVYGEEEEKVAIRELYGADYNFNFYNYFNIKDDELPDHKAKEILYSPRIPLNPVTSEMLNNPPLLNPLNNPAVLSPPSAVTNLTCDNSNNRNLTQEEMYGVCVANGFQLEAYKTKTPETPTIKPKRGHFIWKPLPTPKSCAEIKPTSKDAFGIYNIEISATNQLLSVLCDNSWTVIQHRNNGNENFYRSITDYINGFGDLNGEFWLGLELLHQFTNSTQYELKIELGDIDGVVKQAYYDNFKISSYHKGYSILSLGKYEGDAGDSLGELTLQPFSARKSDNDMNFMKSCAKEYRSGWWFKDCDIRLFSNLNGALKGKTVHNRGIVWETFGNNKEPLHFSKMAIRPRKQLST